MKNSGITLIELLVVISIIGILVVALGFSFVGWQGSYKVESVIKDMFSDMMDARVRAMQRNRFYFADFPTDTSYRLIEDTNDNETEQPGAGDKVLGGFPKKIDYTINWIAAGAPGALPVFIFDNRGILSPEGTIYLTLPSGVEPDYDCIVVSATRIKMGKMTGGACGVK